MFALHRALPFGHRHGSCPGCNGVQGVSYTKTHWEEPYISKAMGKPQWVSIPEFLLVNAYISKSIQTRWAYFKQIM